MNSFKQVLAVIVLFLGVIPYSYSQKLELISKTMSGDAAGGSGGFFAYGLGISHDGRYIVYSSLSPNIVSGDTNKWGASTDYYGPAPDVFLNDRLTKKTIRVSVMPDGSELKQSGSYHPSISADGCMIAYESDGYDFPGVQRPGGMNIPNIFVYNTQFKRPELISISPNGDPADHMSINPRISANGKYVAFVSWATNLLLNIPGREIINYYMSDINAKENYLVTVTMDGKHYLDPSGNIGDDRLSISADGRYV